MCDTTFAFGQNGSHFLQCPSRTDHTRLPPKLRHLLTSYQIAHIYHVTLGSSSSSSFLITYRSKAGIDTIYSDNLPPELNDFLYATSSQGVPLRCIPNTRVSLGPYDESFYATDGVAWLWMNLPCKLARELDMRIKEGKWMDRPRIVALGADRAFVLVTEGNDVVVEVGGYGALGVILRGLKIAKGEGSGGSGSGGGEEVKSVVLHAYRYEGFVLQLQKGTLRFGNLPEWSMSGLKGLQPLLLRDTKEAAFIKKQPEVLKRQLSLRENGEWGGRKQGFVTAQGKGVKVSLSLSLRVGGFGFGNVLG